MQTVTCFEPLRYRVQGNSSSIFSTTILTYPNSQERWAQYEQRKAQLREAGLTPKAYQRAIRELADELGV